MFPQFEGLELPKPKEKNVEKLPHKRTLTEIDDVSTAPNVNQRRKLNTHHPSCAIPTPKPKQKFSFVLDEDEEDQQKDKVANIKKMEPKSGDNNETLELGKVNNTISVPSNLEENRKAIDKMLEKEMESQVNIKMRRTLSDSNISTQSKQIKEGRKIDAAAYRKSFSQGMLLSTLEKGSDSEESEKEMESSGSNKWVQEWFCKMEKEIDRKMCEKALTWRKPKRKSLLSSSPTMSVDEMLEEQRTRLKLVATVASEGKIMESFIPGDINGCLKEYQREGIQWLFQCYCNTKSCILADDMLKKRTTNFFFLMTKGLGKTIQAIGFLAAVNNGEKKNRILICCPNSLVKQWQQELVTWLDNVQWCRLQNEIGIALGPSKYEVWRNKTYRYVLSTYETVAKIIESMEPITKNDDCLKIDSPRATFFDIAIFDEVHVLKRFGSKKNAAVHALPIPMKIGMTGTLVQNNLDELWAIFYALNICIHSPDPSSDNPSQCTQACEWFCDRIFFHSKITLPIEKGNKFGASKEEVQDKGKALQQLKALLDMFVKRRTKDIIKHQLPVKVQTYFIVFCELTEFQIGVYQRLLASPEYQL
ncbi:hypothetical protein RFI_06890, partial [Reticulomyxa filosa]